MTAPCNWIIFLSDNHSRDVAGCYGHPAVQTPAIDRIARGGVRFANAYCTSTICCPSRASIATGRYPHQTAYWDNTLVYDGRVPSWMHRLRDQGSEVVSIGKLHFRGEDDDNGFSQEILPMHIVNGIGGLVGLLRWEDREPVRPGHHDVYIRDSGPGDTDYQAYDRVITRHAIDWLKDHRKESAKPWALFVSYVSPHPPFKVPQHIWDMYQDAPMPLPVQFGADARPRHPALDNIRQKLGMDEVFDAETMRRITAAYCGLVSHTDEQIGQVLAAAEDLGLLATSRVTYTSDHGESAGNHGLFGKYTFYDTTAAVPWVAMGPGVPEGRVVDQIVSHVDLFPTIVEGAGVALEDDDRDLPGISLWPAMGGRETERLGFGEYHAATSRSGFYMLREGTDKLIYYVGMAPQLFDLAADPRETRDLIAAGSGHARAAELEVKLRAMVDPEAEDRRAKADQRRTAEAHGGTEAILARGSYPYTPPPGVEVNYRR